MHTTKCDKCSTDKSKNGININTIFEMKKPPKPQRCDLFKYEKRR